MTAHGARRRLRGQVSGWRASTNPATPPAGPRVSVDEVFRRTLLVRMLQARTVVGLCIAGLCEGLADVDEVRDAIANLDRYLDLIEALDALIAPAGGDGDE